MGSKNHAYLLLEMAPCLNQGWYSGRGSWSEGSKNRLYASGSSSNFLKKNALWETGASSRAEGGNHSHRDRVEQHLLQTLRDPDIELKLPSKHDARRRTAHTQGPCILQRAHELSQPPPKKPSPSFNFPSYSHPWEGPLGVHGLGKRVFTLGLPLNFESPG